MSYIKIARVFTADPKDKDHCGCCPHIEEMSGMCILFNHKLQHSPSYGYDRLMACQAGERLLREMKDRRGA